MDNQTGLPSIRRLPWQQFERLLYEAFRRQGYSVEHRGAAGPDGGIDLVLRRDGAKTLVQCKQWRWERVGVKLVRELLGVVAERRRTTWIFVTSGIYSDDAIAFAEKNRSTLTLIDGKRLAIMIGAVQTKPATKVATDPRHATAWCYRPQGVSSTDITAGVNAATKTCASRRGRCYPYRKMVPLCWRSWPRCGKKAS